MKKNFLQDVVPSTQKRSIRDIPLPSHKGRVPKRVPSKIKKIEEPEEIFNTPLQDSKQEHTDMSEYQEYTPAREEEIEEAPIQRRKIPSRQKRGSFRKKIGAGIILGIVLFLGYMLSRTNATITITPKKETQNIQVSIPFDNSLITQTQISKTVSKTLPATSEQQVEKQASGRIKILNNHKETPQELVKNTRFQTPNGLIYRIRDSIVIPGYTMNGTTIVPGTLEVEVFADSAGEEYNTSNAKFTIPGFSGKEQFEKITAESVGDISGGYIGVRKVVSQEAKDEAQKSLEAQIKTEIEQVQKQSVEYVVVPDFTTITYGEIQDKAEGDSVVVSLSGSVKAYSFVKKDLATFIGKNSISGALESDTFDLDMKSVSFSITEDAINISGSTEITWTTDIETLKNSFTNIKRSEGAALLNSSRSFKNAHADLSPFWKTRFPSDSAKIDVIIQQ